MISSLLLYIIIVVITATIIYLIFFKGRSNEKSSEEVEADSRNFEKDFFSRVEKGEKSILFMTLGNSADLNFIRSMLYAENIPSYVEGEHMNNIYGGISGTMEAVVAVKLYILENDFEAAKELYENSNIKKGDKKVINNLT